MSDPSQSPPSVVAGKYELLGLIGRGGMGSVWEGRHKTLGTRVAIKFIDAEYATSQDARSRFDTEARAAATLQSKHAIQVFDHGMTEDGRPYIVMELLLGEALDKRLARLGPMPVADIARIIRQVTRALARAHDSGIIHRDLKPENIFLVRGPDDDEEVAKVLDFGIAKIKTTPGAVGLSSSTKTGTLLGTPFFMSPEQARGLRSVDHRTDLWSLGVIVFKCTTGVLPFDGESLGDLLVKICTAPIPVPSHVVPTLPPELDAWMARALEREPSQRFQTARELADSLAGLAGLSLRAPWSGGTPDPNAVSTSTPPVEVSPSGPGVSSRGSAPSGVPRSHPTDPTSRPPVSAPPSTTPTPAFVGPEFNQPVSPATSAPITASPRTPGSSRWSVLAAAAVGLILGVVLIGFFLQKPNKPASAGPGASATAPRVTDPPKAADAPATPNKAPDPAITPPSPPSTGQAATADTPPASDTAPATGTVPARPVKAAAKPGSGTTRPAGPSKGASPTTAGVLPTVAPLPTKPANNPAEPGY